MGAPEADREGKDKSAPAPVPNESADGASTVASRESAADWQKTFASTSTTKPEDGTKPKPESSMLSGFGLQQSEPRQVNTGDWEKVDLKKGEAISTKHLGPCVAVISNDGAIAHLNPDWQGPKDVKEFITWLKANTAAGANRSIALVGGMDNKGQSYAKFNSSADLVSYLKKELKEAGFDVKFEDLYGQRQREVVLDSNGKISISDGWNKDYHKSFSFSESGKTEARPQPIADRRPERVLPKAEKLQSTDIAVNSDGTVQKRDVSPGEKLAREQIERRDKINPQEIQNMRRSVEDLAKSEIPAERERGLALQKTIDALEGKLGPEAQFSAHNAMLNESRKALERGESGGYGKAVTGGLIGIGILTAAALAYYASSFKQQQDKSLERAKVR